LLIELFLADLGRCDCRCCNEFNEAFPSSGFKSFFSVSVLKRLSVEGLLGALALLALLWHALSLFSFCFKINKHLLIRIYILIYSK
jgi:hypothetical protein